ANQQRENQPREPTEQGHAPSATSSTPAYSSGSASTTKIADGGDRTAAPRRATSKKKAAVRTCRTAAFASWVIGAVATARGRGRFLRSGRRGRRAIRRARARWSCSR